MNNNVTNAIKEMEKIHQSALEKTFNILIRTIKESNNIDYEPLNVLRKDYDGYQHESFVGIIIFECYTLLQIIKNAGITEDNYKTQEEKFNRAAENIKKLSNLNCDIPMLPKLSRVLYVLKYYLHHHFDTDKTTTKYILDEIADREPNHSRMPRNNENLNEEIALINAVNDYKFNTHEGKEKWQYFVMSIFSLQEFKEFKNLVYNNDLLNKIMDDEFIQL